MKKFKVISVILILILSVAFLFMVFSFDLKRDIAYGLGERNYLDIYQKRDYLKEKDLKPAIILLHGGGWTAGDKSDFKVLGKQLAKNGYAAVAMNYSFVDGTITCYDILEDIDNAIKFIKENGDRYGIDTKRIALIGGSAGGHLALLYANLYVSPIDIAFVISLAGPTDLNDEGYFDGILGDYFFELMQKATGVDYEGEGDKPQEWADISPINNISNLTPPTLLAHGVLDDVVPYSNALAYYNKLQEFNVPSHLVTYENSGHALGDKEGDAQFIELFSLYFETYLPIN